MVDKDRNQFAAIYADSEDSNCGLPFWLGKITNIDRHRNPEEEDPALEDAEEASDTYEAVEIADYYQKTKMAPSGKREGTGRYEEARESTGRHGKARKGTRGHGKARKGT